MVSNFNNIMASISPSSRSRRQFRCLRGLALLLKMDDVCWGSPYQETKTRGTASPSTTLQHHRQTSRVLHLETSCHACGMFLLPYRKWYGNRPCIARKRNDIGRLAARLRHRGRTAFRRHIRQTCCASMDGIVMINSSFFGNHAFFSHRKRARRSSIGSSTCASTGCGMPGL